MAYGVKNIYIVFIVGQIILAAVFLVTAGGALAADPATNAAITNACSGISDSIKQGHDAAQVVRTAITKGVEPSTALPCAIMGGGDIVPIISGALEAGVKEEVVVYILLREGVKPEDIVMVFRTLGYSPDTVETLVPEPARLGRTGGKGRSISPYGF